MTRLHVAALAGLLCCTTAGEAKSPTISPAEFAQWAASRGFVAGVGSTTARGTFIVDRLRYSSNGDEIVVHILLRKLDGQ